jgi:hypothetical protein
VGCDSRPPPVAGVLVEVDPHTSAVTARLDRFAQRIGLAIVKSREGQARRFVAWGREIEYVVLEDGAVRASALVDDEPVATSTNSVEWMQQLMLKARADQRAATKSDDASASAPTELPSRARRRPRPAQPEHTQPTAQPRPSVVKRSATGPSRRRAPKRGA